MLVLIFKLSKFPSRFKLDFRNQTICLPTTSWLNNYISTKLDSVKQFQEQIYFLFISSGQRMCERNNNKFTQIIIKQTTFISGALWSNDYGIGLRCQGCRVQVPPSDSFSRQIFKTEEKEAEKQNALVNLTTRRKREQG